MSTLKIGPQRYKLKEDLPITHERYLRLKEHPQAGDFYFKQTRQMWYWYVKNKSEGNCYSVTEKVQNKILHNSYTKWLNKSKDNKDLQENEKK